MRARGIVLATAACFASLVAGCTGDVAPPRPAHLVEGSGYSTIVVDERSNSTVAAAALRGDRQLVALLYEDGLLELRNASGARVKSWQIDEAPRNCDPNRHCGLEFLSNGTLLIYAAGEAGIYSLEGGRLWHWSPSSLRQGIVALESAANGTLVLVGFNDGTAEVRNLGTGEEIMVPVSGGGPVTDVSASDNGGVVATAGGSVGVYNAGAALLAEVARAARVVVAGDGKTVFAWGHVVGDVHDLLAIDLTAQPPSVRNLSVEGASGPYPTQWDPTNRVDISTNGRFAAVPAILRFEECGSNGCSPQMHDYVRVVDLHDPGGDYGLGAFRPVRVFLGDNGSAFAVSAVPVPPNAFRIEFTTAAAGATPPRAETDTS